MLSAFTARPIVELRQRDKSKIETILAHGDRVLVGLNTGALRIYRLNELPPQNGAAVAPPATESSEAPSADTNGKSLPSSGQHATKPPVKPTDLLREVEKFSTRAVEQLAIIKEANTLVSLSNYHVSLHDLQSYEPIETLSRTKNASCFAVTSNIVKDQATGIPEIISRLAVAVKRRLLIWSWHESELRDDITEIVLPESIRTVTWVNATKLVCGMNAGYVLVDVTTAETQEISGQGAPGVSGAPAASRFGAASMGYMGLGGYMPKPLATRLTEGQMLLAKDINSLFVDTEGKPQDKRQIPWQSAPESIGYSYPYILALQAPSKGSLEVRNPDTLSLLQSIELPGAAQLHFAPPTVSLAHAAKGFHVSSDRVVWKMDATDYDTQVQELVRGERFDEAISILGMLEDALLKDKTGTLREIKMLKAEMLFKQKKFRDSLDLFNEDDVHAPPERVLRLYPRSIAGELSSEPIREETPEEPEEEDAKAVPIEGQAEKSSNPPSIIEAASPAKGRGGFASYWIGGGHRKTDSDAASIASSTQKTVPEDDNASIQAAPKPKPAEDGAMDNKELMTAVRELNSYLAGTRARLQRYIDPATGKLKPRKPELGTSQSTVSHADSLDALLTNPRSQSDESLEQELRDTFTLVDTTLFRGYMFASPSLAGSLFRIPNFCDPAVVNEKLLEHNRYNELVDFFYGKKLHREALELLRRFGNEETANGKVTVTSAEEGTTSTSTDGDDTTTTPPPEEVEIPEQLRGPRRTVGYLQSLPPDKIDLVLEFAEWVLRRDPDLGMEVFVADSENAETLPRDRVVKFLGDISPELEARYLEHIIGELSDGTPDFHNRLVELLVQMLRNVEDPEQRGDEWHERLGSLVAFLRESSQYGLYKAHNLLPKDDPAFYEAQAVVLSNMGQHKQALEIYVFKIKDFAKAEEYCNRIHVAGDPSSPVRSRPSTATGSKAGFADDDDYDEDDAKQQDAAQSIYHTLLSLYMAPPAPHKPNLEPALSLLSRHGSRLPATSTVSLIPNDLPVKELESYFRGRIRAANSVVNESRIVEGLRKTQFVNTQALLLLGDGVPGGQGGRNRRVVISEERVCRVCHKRIGNTVIAVLPDNSAVHYGCLGRSGQQQQVGNRVAGSWGRSG
ncbi:vacuolar sorting protein 39 domain 2-domain-containing protein [Microdochium trichocladiopsis]|uniref:Vacuolar sorting protein 39 domain 2-domain-containing protein n=1 Tax=Microdochium trichocladiopsis TaxID=1682393 RepID=A0A9P8XWX1_9PEZI|nr:vacuolar sorting protein 39 domain 2-domain-containing protein [Microdochium trichocladiopsis]KAH7021442.1 vacuolar sorting protein 39 domain 2-domain-containing protein [Microdochium trichocladiopsis]